MKKTIIFGILIMTILVLSGCGQQTKTCPEKFCSFSTGWTKEPIPNMFKLRVYKNQITSSDCITELDRLTGDSAKTRQCMILYVTDFGDYLQAYCDCYYTK